MTTKTNEREAFEAWYESHLMPLEADWFKRDHEGDYTAMDTQSSWDSWQARSKLSTKQEWIPDGYILAPKEATQEMSRAGYHASQKPKALLRDIYKSMINASPRKP